MFARSVAGWFALAGKVTIYFANNGEIDEDVTSGKNDG